MVIFFWIIFIITFLPFAAYLLLLWFSSKNGSDISADKSLIPEKISIVLPCHNESSNIERKIHELLRETQSFKNFEIIVINDGACVETKTILAKFINKQIRVMNIPVQKGKANAINIAVQMSAYDTIIFSDCRQRIKRGAVNKLVTLFCDNNIGIVSASLRNGPRKSIIRDTVNYLKQLESDSDSTVGVYGGLYAMRKSCFVPLPVDTILDDLVIPLQVLKLNKKVKFETEAIVYDLAIEKFYTPSRILRIAWGLLQVVSKHHRLITSLSPRLLLYLYCQKYFKLIFPFLVLMMVSAGLLILPVKWSFIIFIFVIFYAIFFRTYQEVKTLRRIFVVYLLRLFQRRKKNPIHWGKLKGNVDEPAVGLSNH